MSHPRGSFGANEAPATDSQPSQAGFMDRALQAAREAAARGEVPVGAVIVKDGSIIATTSNRMRELNDATAHAEMLALRAAGVALGSERLIGCDLYVTLEPCTMCAGAISLARVRRLYYAAPDEKGGAVDHGVRFFSQPTCHHAPDVYGGLAETEAKEILVGFFRERR